MVKSGLVKAAALAVVLLLSASAYAAENAPAATAEAVQCQESCTGVEKNLCNMGRGLVNIVTCWLEVPRCLVYHNSQLPVLGVVVGACQGAGFTVIRAFAGVADIASFGFMSDSIYTSCHDFNEWVWDSRWVPHNN